MCNCAPSQEQVLSTSCVVRARPHRPLCCAQDADVKADVTAEDKAAYKKDDFFDELSRESREGGPGRSWLSEQRKLDMETFGMVRPCTRQMLNQCARVPTDHAAVVWL